MGFRVAAAQPTQVDAAPTERAVLPSAADEFAGKSLTGRLVLVANGERSGRLFPFSSEATSFGVPQTGPKWSGALRVRLARSAVIPFRVVP